MPPLSFFHHYPLKFKLNLVGYLYRADLRSARRKRQHSIEECNRFVTAVKIFQAHKIRHRDWRNSQ